MASYETTWLQNLLKDTQKDSCDQEAGEVLDNPHHRHHDAPAHNQYTEVVRRTLEALQQHVRRNLEQNVRYEEHR